MPRDGSGNYSLPAGTDIADGQTASATPIQTVHEDLETEMSGSLPVTGSKGMSGQLQLQSGSTDASPGIRFAEDAKTGWFRGAANQWNFTASGSEVGNMSANGWSGQWAQMPAGTKAMFQQTAAPTGWTQVTDAAYNDAFMRVVNDSSATTGGTNTVSGFAMTAEAQLFAHSHDAGTLDFVTDDPGNHNHSLGRTDNTNTSGSANRANGGGTGGSISDGNTGNDGAHTHSAASWSGTSEVVGSGAATWDLKYVDLIVCTRDA